MRFFNCLCSRISALNFNNRVLTYAKYAAGSVFRLPSDFLLGSLEALEALGSLEVAGAAC